MPVEIFDFSIPYKGNFLEEAWESYSEYHITTGDYDFRVISPVSLYYDIVKRLESSNKNTQITRKNKTQRRKWRINVLLNEIFIPYGNYNNVIQNNIRRHTRSQGRIGNAVRSLVSEIEKTQEIIEEDDGNVISHV
jgi:hypothetical protein